MNKALSYWEVAFQYLDLSENVSRLIAESGNKWCVIQDGFDEEAMLENYRESTKWTDYNMGIPVLFNFYHGIELLLKGFVITIDPKINTKHSIATNLEFVKKHHPEATFFPHIELYIHEHKLPHILKEFIQETSSTMDDWYQAFKYPESVGGKLYAHNKLVFRTGEGAKFYGNLANTIHDIRLSAVKYARGKGYA